MKELPRLYAITDRKVYGKDFLGTLKKVLDMGVRMIQLREKGTSGREYYRLAKKVRELTKEYDALLLINERFDIAMAVGADGVHLPEESFPPSRVKVINPDLIVGLSAHSPESALRAQEEGADFVTISPIFKTSSHPNAKPLSPGIIKETAKKVKIPIYALGGITWEKTKVCYKNGAYGVAGITMFIHGKNTGNDT